MASLNLIIATMRADGRLPKSPCAKIEKLKQVEKATREKRVRVEQSAKKQRTKAIEKLTQKVKREVHEIDETYGKPGQPMKCAAEKVAVTAAKPAKPAKAKPAKAKRASKKDSPALRQGIRVEKKHGHGVKRARQIAVDHLAKDPHFYDKAEHVPPQATAKESAARAKKVARKKLQVAGKAARSGQKEVADFEEKIVKATKADVKKAKAAIKREAAAAKKAASKQAAAAKREAKKQAKAGAYRPPVEAAKPARVVKPPKPPKAPREKKTPPRRIDLPPPQPRDEVFVADSATDAAKTAMAMQGFDDIVARQIARLRAANSPPPPVESMPRRRAMY